MTPPAGSSRKGLLSQDDFLAPPHIPTGQPPKDVLNTIWRKNDVFLDIGSYSIGSFVMIMWPLVLLFIFILPLPTLEDSDELKVLYWFGFMCFCGFPILMLLYLLTQRVPLPVRFNRQRREVCVPRDDGTHWIVPWEQVTAAATSVSSIGQHGKTTQGLLVVGFTNPDPNAKKEDRELSLGFSCGGGTTAMCLWECMRSYMEVGPDAVPKCNFEGEKTGKGLLGWFFSLIGDVIRSILKGDFKSAFKDLFFTFFLGAPLGFYLQERKLVPPPDLTAPEIVDWSKPLPPEQWAKRSAALEQAIGEREAQLAARSRVCSGIAGISVLTPLQNWIAPRLIAWTAPNTCNPRIPHDPTRQLPKDVLNTIWRKNDVFLDIGNYSIGSAVIAEKGTDLFLTDK